MKFTLGLHWIILTDGIIWFGLTVLSALAFYDRMSPSWLLIVLWFSLHPIVAFTYFTLTKWSMHYPRYIWSIKTWNLLSFWLWLYQSLFFVHHIVSVGFFEHLDSIDAASASISGGIILYSWFGAFWTEYVQPFSLIRLGDIHGFDQGQHDAKSTKTV